MHRNTRWLLLFVAWPLGLWLAIGLSQVPRGATAAEPPASALVEPVQRASLDIFMRAADGQLVPFSDLTVDELAELHDLKNRQELPERPPAFAVQSVLGSGQAKQGFAELSFVFDIVVSSQYGARVPLGLPEARLRRAADYQGPGRLIRLDLDEDNGYVAYLRGSEAEEHHQLTLDVSVPIDSLGADFRMRLSTPHSTRSELKLTVPLADARAEISGRGDEPVATITAPNDESSTLFTIQGLEWDQEIVWRQADNRGARLPPVLSVEGDVLAKIDPAEVVTAATLTVYAGEEFDRFRVRLPRSAELLVEELGEYKIALVQPDGSAAGGGPGADGPTAQADNSEPDDRPVVEVQFPKRKMAEVTLTVRQVHQPSQVGEFFELGRFEVLDALGQGGRIRVVVAADDDDDWQVVWGLFDRVRQFSLDEDPSEEAPNLVGVFRYWSQPCSLPARAVPRRTWISVEPEYYLSVRRGRVELKADLHYTIRGSARENEVFPLNVVLPGWSCDRIEKSGELIDVSVEAGSSGLISIPLERPARDEADITIHAYRDIDPAAGLLSFSLPRPDANSVDPALVRIQPDDDVRLLPRFDDIQGLYRPRQRPPSEDPTDGQQDPLFFYVDGVQAVFSADVSFHEQSISVDVVSTANLLADTAEVEQTLTYDIDYKAAEELILAVPQRLAESLAAKGDQVRVFLDDERLDLVDPSGESGSPPSEPPTVFKRVILPWPRFSCELTVRYPIDPIPLQPEQSVHYSIPLVMPVDGRLGGNDLYVQTPVEVEVRLAEAIGLDSWPVSTTASERFPRRNELHLTSSRPVGGASLMATPIDRDLLGSTLIEQAWIQTWLTKDQRRDRAVFRFTSDREHLLLWLPEGMDLGNVKVYLDGTRREPESASRDRPSVKPPDQLLVKLTPDPENRPHVLEIVCHGPRGDDRGRMSLELPRVGDGVWARRTYWQLILPRDEHVVWEPKNCTSEFHWGWTGLFWGRVPTMGQSDLERWISADEQTPLPSQTSRYLFSSLGPIERVDLWTADRTWIFLPASGVVLLAGLGLIYFQAVRRPAVVFVLAVPICAAAAIHPPSALLLAQAASLGLALTLLAGLLHRALGRRGRRPVRQDAYSSILDRGSTETQLHAPKPDSSASTDTAPVAVPPSEQEPRR